jgi:UDP-3-O-[3-hydroxymyristoyl] glucosamine N-acyltransferase
MQLSEFSYLDGFELVQDAPFSVTGKLSTPLERILVPLRSGKFADAVNQNPRITCVVTTREIAHLLAPHLGVAIAARPDDVHSEIHAVCAKHADDELRRVANDIAVTASVHQSAQVAEYGVRIGDSVEIGANVVIYPGTIIESGSVVHAGTILGLPGFNTGKIGGRQRIVPPIGGVRIGRHVELLGNVCIARAVYGGYTTVGRETLVDNLAYIAHDCIIGDRVQICALVCVLGRVVIGDDVYLGPSAVVVNGAKVGAKARVSMGAVVTKDVPAGSTVSGNFAIEHSRFLSHIKAIR